MTQAPVPSSDARADDDTNAGLEGMLKALGKPAANAVAEDAQRCGLVAIVGKPNVGKSTLLNALVGQKISITSRKAQTTRHRITGILTTEDAQYVFVDTPGFQTKFSNALNRAMNRGVSQALAEVDAILYVVEAGRYSLRDKAVERILPDGTPVILVVNKMDQLKSDRERMISFLTEMAAVRPWAAIVPVSAKSGRQTDELLGELKKLLPQEGLLFSEDEITDKSERFLASEYIREKLFRLLGDELPYSTTVEIEKFEHEGDLRRIFAAIVVDREGHKAIVIGKGGESMKRIASEARQDMERLFDGKVYLEIWVKVKSGWADDDRLVKSLGYE